MNARTGEENATTWIRMTKKTQSALDSCMMIFYRSVNVHEGCCGLETPAFTAK
jgi:hypothetical protein